MCWWSLPAEYLLYCDDPMTARYINPKHLVLMHLALSRIYEGTFDEGDIKNLLLGMRDCLQEASLKSRQMQSAPAAIRLGLPYLVDIAHSIAHPEMKDQGPIRNYVKSADFQMAKALKKMPRHRIFSTDEQSKTINIALPPAIKPLKAYDLTIAFLSFLPEIFPEAIELDTVAKQGSDIEICLLSLLHYMQLPLLDDPVEQENPNELRHGYLAFHTWQGSHHIYAGVVNSHYGNVLSGGSNQNARAKPFINVLPVFNSAVPADGDLTFDARNPAILFAERGASEKLVLKVIGVLPSATV